MTAQDMSSFYSLMSQIQAKEKEKSRMKEYAIIKSGATGLLEVVKLTEWDSWEWDNFATVKSYNDGEIVWFYTEENAVMFMFANFPKELIHSKYSQGMSFNKKYYID